MSLNPFETLGVAPDSGPADWKRAYRRLAMRWHPDRNPAPEATERFKAIGSAYEALLAGDSKNAPESENADEAPPQRDPRRQRASDIRHNLELALEEAAAGCRRTFHVVRKSACDNCAGTGEAGLARTRFCSHCHGSGRVKASGKGIGKGLEPCSDCGGRGVFSERTCSACDGAGHLSSEIELVVSVPPGVLAGDEVRLVGQGEPGGADRQPGDLFLTVVLRDHRLFKLDGRDLHYVMPVSALLLMAGGPLALPGLLGELSFDLPPGQLENREIHLKGSGFPGRGRSAAGDLRVTLRPVFPTALDARQRELLQQANAALMADAASALPEVAAWQAKFQGP